VRRMTGRVISWLAPICLTALGILARLRDKESQEAFRQAAANADIGTAGAALQDEHWYVRRAARESLTNLTGRGFGGDYGKWREWLDSVGSP